MDNGLYRLIYGFDSFGNICNRANKIYFIQSYVLYFDYENPKTTTKVCVKTCPSEEITTPSQFESFTKMNGNLCLYNTTTGVYNKENCPKLPIYRTYI